MSLRRTRIKYEGKYPDVEISTKVLEVLEKSDNKMKYMQRGLKIGKAIHVNAFTGVPTYADDPNATKADYMPGREISLDLLFEIREKRMIGLVDEFKDPLFVLIRKERYQRLHNCLELLTAAQRDLIVSLFWSEMTEAEYAASIGRGQSSVNEMKHRALVKLKELLIQMDGKD